MKKVILTKKRLDDLHIALTMDDILYEKFKRLNDQLQKDAQRLIANRKKVFRVIKRNDDFDEIMQIKEVRMSDYGSEIVI